MSERFAFIGAEEADPTSGYPVTMMCRLLAVSTSGFYHWCRAAISPRARRRATVSTHVQVAFDAGRGTYGVRRVHAVLARSTDPQVASVSLKMVRSVMAELDLHACQPRAYKVTTVQDGSVTPTIGGPAAPGLQQRGPGREARRGHHLHPDLAGLAAVGNRR